MKTKILLLILLFTSLLFAQKKESFSKLKQSRNEKQFYNLVFRNPSLMSYYGNHKVSKIETFFEESRNEAYLMQKPVAYTNYACLIKSFFPIDSSKTVWGEASYNNFDIKNIEWNETQDYELNYPYLTADSIGGKMNVEKYAFQGGYSKKYKNIDLGLFVKYKGCLSSRDVDPRPKNLSSDLNLKFGVNFKNLKSIDAIGLYANGQRYIQSSDIAFHNKIKGSSTVYNLNGIGNFNYLLKGSKLKSYYNGYGYGTGLELSFSKKKDFFLTVDYDNLNIEKWIIDINIPTASSLTNRNINANLVKFFPYKKNKFGVKFNYEKKMKEGVEPTFSLKKSYINTLKTEKNYDLLNTIYTLSGLYYIEKDNTFFKVKPYFNYQRYREKYYLIKSFQFFDSAKIGIKYDYLHNGADGVLSILTDMNYSKNLNSETLFRDDSELALSQMLRRNASYLSENIFKTSVSLQYSHQLRSRLNLFYGIKSDVAVVDSKINTMYNFSTGIIF